jgi:hypothetical protein
VIYQEYARMNLQALNASQWGWIFTLLSMDISRPFLDAMGLGWLPIDTLKPHLRRWIIENRERYQAEPSVVPDLAGTVFMKVQSEFGEPMALRLYDWATHVFCNEIADPRGWQAWHIALHHGAYNSRAQEALSLPAGRRGEILSAFRERVGTRDIKREIRRLQSERLSAWDLEMYAIHQFNEETGPDPFDVIIDVVEMHRMQVFWPDLSRMLTPDEQRELWESARQVLAQLGLSAAATLPMPAQMGRG